MRSNTSGRPHTPYDTHHAEHLRAGCTRSSWHARMAESSTVPSVSRRVGDGRALNRAMGQRGSRARAVDRLATAYAATWRIARSAVLIPTSRRRNKWPAGTDVSGNGARGCFSTPDDQLPAYRPRDGTFSAAWCTDAHGMMGAHDAHASPQPEAADLSRSGRTNAFGVWCDRPTSAPGRSGGRVCPHTCRTATTRWAAQQQKPQPSRSQSPERAAAHRPLLVGRRRSGSSSSIPSTTGHAPLGQHADPGQTAMDRLAYPGF